MMAYRRALRDLKNPSLETPNGQGGSIFNRREQHPANSGIGVALQKKMRRHLRQYLC